MKRIKTLFILSQFVLMGTWAMQATISVNQDVVEEVVQIENTEDQIEQSNQVTADETPSMGESISEEPQELVKEPYNKGHKVHKATTEVPETVDAEKPNSIEESQKSSKSSYFIIGFIVICLLYKIVRFYTRRRCFKCGRPWAMKVVKKEFCGTDKTEKKQVKKNEYIKSNYNKYKITRQCKYCGHKDVYYEKSIVNRTYINH